MRIGHVMADVWAPGGVATYLRRVSAWQRAAGHEVVFFDTTPAPAADVVHAPDGPALARDVRARGVDVLHAHAEIVGPLDGLGPLVRTVHGHQPYCPSGSRYLPRQGVCTRPVTVAGCTWGHVVDRCGSARAAQIRDGFRRTASDRALLRHHPALAVSAYGRDAMVREGYDPAGVSVVLHAAPDIDPAPWPDGPPRFLFAGRLTPSKGLRWALDALARTRSDVRLDVAGTGWAEAALRRHARALGLGDRVAFVGWMDAAALADRMAQAWAVVVPSLWPEPAGLVTLEAHALARPVLASRVGGIPEYTRDGACGLLVPPGDVEALAAAMDRLASDAALAERMGAAGRAHVEARHTMEAHMAGLGAAYDGVLAAARP